MIGKLASDQATAGVAAAFVGEITPNDLDGARWRFVATDGRTLEFVDACLSGSNGGRRGMVIEPAVLEREIERRAAGFPIESRLRDLRDASPLVLQR